MRRDGDHNLRCRLVPVPSGRAYRVASPPANAMMTRELADELSRVLERFAIEAGFNDKRPVSVFFRPGIFGHHQLGHAADIYAGGGVGIDEWKRRWNGACKCAAQTADPAARQIITRREPVVNLGWRLDKALRRAGTLCRWLEVRRGLL